jgi:hypothetical protein
MGVGSNFLHWNTCMSIIHISTCKMSPRCTGCSIINGTVSHTHSIEETLLRYGLNPKLLYNLLFTVWSMKLPQIFVVLQPGGSFNPSLLEAIVQITSQGTCGAANPFLITDRMICTVPPSGFQGPCWVRN